MHKKSRHHGNPLKLVEARGHLFFRWDDPLGRFFGSSEVFNVEGAGEGIASHPDDFYRTWPEPWTSAEHAAGCYLRSLRPPESWRYFSPRAASVLKASGNWTAQSKLTQSDMDRPLYLDERIEQRERARLKHVFARWLKRFLPALAYRGPAGAAIRRDAVASTVGLFTGSVEFAWAAAGIVAILEIIREQIGLPNHNFLPDDSLALIMNSVYDLDDVYALANLRRDSP